MTTQGTHHARAGATRSNTQHAASHAAHAGDAARSNTQHHTQQQHTQVVMQSKYVLTSLNLSLSPQPRHPYFSTNDIVMSHYTSQLVFTFITGTTLMVTTVNKGGEEIREEQGENGDMHSTPQQKQHLSLFSSLHSCSLSRRYDTYPSFSVHTHTPTPLLTLCSPFISHLSPATSTSSNEMH